MADDHFERFKSNLIAAKPKATQDQRSGEFDAEFAELKQGVERLRIMLDEHQPGSSIGWQLAGYNEQEDQHLHLRGAKFGGRGFIIQFIYQPGKLKSPSAALKSDVNLRHSEWTVEQQDVLIRKLTDQYGEFFSKN